MGTHHAIPSHKRTLRDEDVLAVHSLRDMGVPVSEISRRLGISIDGIYLLLARKTYRGAVPHSELKPEGSECRS